MLLRSVFMLSLAAVVYRELPGTQTAVFFQILFFQAVVIAFLSASGFFRAQALDTDADAIAYLSAMLLLVAPSVLLPVGLFLSGAGYAEYGAELSIIWLGAVATSLGAPLSGYVMRTLGPFRAFVPSAVSAIIAVGLLISVGQWSRWLPYALMVTFQVGAFVLLGLQVPHLLKGACLALWQKGVRPAYARVYEGASVGMVNVLHLAVIFTLRHQWEQRADAEIVAAVFLMLRFSDTGIQLLHMVLSGHAHIERLIRSPLMLWFLISTTVAGLVGIWGVSLLTVSPLVFAIFGQIAVDLIRYPGSLGFLYQMKLFKLDRYIRFTLVPPTIAAAIAAHLIYTGSPFAIYAMIAALTLAGVTLSLRDARR